MQKINFQNLPSTTTPVNATNLNALQDNVEDVFDGSVPAGNMVVDSIKTKNLIPVEKQFSVNTSRSVYVKIPSGTYTISGKITGDANYNSLIIFNKNGTELTSVSLNHSGNLSQSTFTLTNEIDEIILYSNSTWATSSGQTSTFDEIQLEKGSTTTTFSPYQDLKNQENYSTSEQKIGTWINGKPIYKETQTTTGNSSNTQEIFHKDNIDTIIKAEGWAKNGSDLRNVISNFYGDMGWSSQFYFSTLYGGLGIIECGNDYANFKNGATINMTLYYTKTTD